MRSVAAEIADFDGDGAADLLRVGFAGIPPEERRALRVYLQREGRIPERPSFELPLPDDAAAYDVADVKPAPGEELLLLQPAGLLVLSLASAEAPRWSLPIAGGVTLAAGADELGLDRLRIVSRAFGPEPWLLVPLPRECAALSPEGRELARWDVGARANYYLARRPGPLSMGTDLQLRVDTPRLDPGDVDGDGRADLVAIGRYELRVFLRRPDGSFARAPDRVLRPPLVSERDHLRGSGAVRGEARDLDGDGRLDLLLSVVSGGLVDAHTRTSIYMNRGGAWNMAAPDRVFESAEAWTLEDLLDLDGDGRLELVRTGVPFGVLALIEVLLTRAFDAEVRVYRPDPEHGFAEQPWLRRELSLPMSFDTGRMLGFVPTARVDLNGDGQRDLLTSGAGDRLEIFLGGEGKYRRSARQELRTSGRMISGDLDGDGLPDLVLYDPRDPGAALRIAHNRGILEGTLPRVGARPR
jgi:hypothetical protein